jgi:hypothetical protein
MVKNLIRASVFLIIGSSVLAQAADTAPPTAAPPPSVAVRARNMRMKLAQPVNYLEKGVDPNTKLQDVLDLIEQKSGLLILVDTEAFKTDLQIENVHEQPVTLPKMAGLRLSTVLRKLSGAVGGTYLVLPDHILITTPAHARPEGWVINSLYAPVVDVEFDKVPVQEALREMSDLTGINIVLDARAGEKARTPVTATLNNAPVNTAVQLLADMADLESVTEKGALYVTTKENAPRLRARQKADALEPMEASIPIAQ